MSTNMITSTVTPASAPKTPVPVTPLFRDRTITSQGAARGQLSTLTLEEVRDDIRRRVRLQDPVDDTRILGLTHLDFHGSPRVTMNYIDKTGVQRKGIMSEHAFRQLATDVLPARGGGFLQELLATGPTGGQIATAAWTQFVQRTEA